MFYVIFQAVETIQHYENFGDSLKEFKTTPSYLYNRNDIKLLRKNIFWKEQRC